MLRKFVIEREIPCVGGKNATELAQAANASNQALAQLDGIQWQHSFVTADKTFCIYLAESEEVIREHARISGFPANKITEVVTIIDPSTASSCVLS